MVAEIEQIQQDLVTLEATARAIAEDLHRIYGSYLQVLGQAIYQQLILAAYHVCTQAYPEAFLELSLEQQQKLQAEFKRLGQEIQAALQESLHPLTELLQQNTLIDPNQLEQEHEEIEQKIDQELQWLSQQSNQVLENFGILAPGHLEIALKALLKEDKLGMGRSNNSYPHLISLIVATPETSEILGETTVEITIVVIYLQLSEIEFTAPTVGVWRNQIRQLVAKIQQLQQDYAEKLEALVIAKAAAAWRASWVKE